MYRVLKPHGRLVMSDPTCEQPISAELRNDERLRALCLSGEPTCNGICKDAHQCRLWNHRELERKLLTEF